MEILEDEWSVAVAQSAPQFETNESLVVDVVLSTGRGSGRTLQWRVADGRLAFVAERDFEADLVLTVTPKDAEAIARGELTVPVAYMQGRLKPAGGNELWLRLAKSSTSPQFGEWTKSVAAL